MPTRAVIESRLVPRCSGWLALVGMSLAEDGTNRDLDDPLLEALSLMGLPTADQAIPTDADLAQVPAGRVRELLKRAELRLLESILGHWQLPSRQIGIQSRFQWGEINLAIQRAIDRVRAEIDREWGIVPAGVATAAITLPATDPCDLARNLRWAPP